MSSLCHKLFTLALWLACTAVGAAEFDHQHALFGQVLKTHVREGLVDYASLRAKPDTLVAYLDQVAAISEDQFNQWTREEQIAFLLNLYNAATLQLIIDHYPVSSIKRIGGLFGNPWRQRVVRIFGRVSHLDEIEHGMLRPRYQEPRIHFALVCAAISCPELRGEPFVPERLSSQLDDEGRRFLGTTAKNRVDPRTNTVHLSPIFKWFREDFESGGGSVLEFVAPYFPDAQRSALGQGKFRIRYTDYDWSLNKQKGG